MTIISDLHLPMDALLADFQLQLSLAASYEGDAWVSKAGHACILCVDVCVCVCVHAAPDATP